MKQCSLDSKITPDFAVAEAVEVAILRRRRRRGPGYNGSGEKEADNVKVC